MCWPTHFAPGNRRFIIGTAQKTPSTTTGSSRTITSRSRAMPLSWPNWSHRLLHRPYLPHEQNLDENLMQPIEIRRENGKYPLDPVRRAIQTYGIVVLKGLLPPETRAPLRQILEGKVEQGRRQAAWLPQTDFPKADFLLGDVLAVRELEAYRYIFFQAEVLEAIQSILETRELVYWGDSSVQFGEAARGFHKDNTNRNDGKHDDWTRNYELVRCGFYFQDHVDHSGGLKVRLRSHDIPNHLDGRMADIPAEYGDLVIWNMRLTHSGNNKRLRLPLKLPLHPRLEEKLPTFLAAPEQ